MERGSGTLPGSEAGPSIPRPISGTAATAMLSDVATVLSSSSRYEAPMYQDWSGETGSLLISDHNANRTRSDTLDTMASLNIPAFDQSYSSSVCHFRRD
jgi:hypothetical protein